MVSLTNIFSDLNVLIESESSSSDVGESPVSSSVWSNGSSSSVEDPPYSWVPVLVVNNVSIVVGVPVEVSST